MRIRALACVVALIVGATVATRAQAPTPADLETRIDAVVADVLAKTHVPSVIVGVVQRGAVTFTKAYGRARLDPALPARVDMRYPVGSISKQFTAACVLLLQQDGRLSIDDPVGKYFPELTRSGEVTIRHLLSHTSGYQDYAPQDYTIPAWTKPTTPEAIIHEWAMKPLDFEPGAEYQYSNTNFNIAGLIVQLVSRQPFWTFLSTRVLQPLGMSMTIDLDAEHGKVEAVGYMRNAFGPLRPARIEAPGWYFADGEMAMPVGDLLRWDISLMNQSLLAPASYVAMETDQRLSTGQTARYGLGVSVSTRDGRRVVSHGGEVGGFVAQNVVYPDDKVAVAVLTNQEASSAAGTVARAVAAMVLPPPVVATPAADTAKAEAQAKAILTGLQKGAIDRALFTANGNFYFDAVAIGDFQSSLGPLGAVQSVTQRATSLRGGMRYRAFTVTFANGAHGELSTYTTRDGLLEQFLLDAAN